MIGTGNDARRARAAGFRVSGQYAPPLRNAGLGWRGLGRLMEGSTRGRAAVCLSPLAGAVGAACAVRTIVVAGFPPARHEPGRMTGAAWLGSGARCVDLLARAARRMRAVDVLPADPLAAEGWPSARAWRVHTPWTAAPTRSGIPHARGELRRMWGITDDVLAVGLVGGPPAASDAMRALDIVGRAALLGVRAALIIHPRTARAREAVRWSTRMPHAGPVVVSTRMGDPWHVAGALDAGLVVSAPDSAGDALDALVLARLGLPIVASEDSPANAWSAVRSDRVSPENRFAATARVLHAVAGEGAAARASLPAVAPPGPEQLLDRIRGLLSSQRAAA